MLNEKSPGSVWNVAFVAVALFLGAMALGGVITSSQTQSVAVSVK